MSTLIVTMCLACSLPALGHTSQLSRSQSSVGIPQQQVEATKPAKTDNGDPAEKKPADRVDDRILGVMPNHGTVKDAPDVPNFSARQSMRLAAMDSFDPFMFPYVGAVAALSQVQHQNPSFGSGVSGYAKRYATSFADNAVGNFLTTAILPIALHQDPRYFQLGTGSFLHRLGYATSRTVVARGLDGHRRFFNVSEIGGNAIAAGLSNLYRPADDRSVAGSLTLWGTQEMWDTVANTAKEFWPDIHRWLRPH